MALNSRLLTAARRGGANPPEQVDLGRAIRDSLEVARAHDPVRGCRIDFANGGHFVLVTHPLLVHQIVMNLVLNAAEATEGHGRIDVRISGGPHGVTIEVHDNGPGVAPERRERIFEALETTKQGGSGLGLFSVRACATALGATVEVTDSPLGGACFRLRLPDHAPAMNGDPIHELVGLAGPAGGARRA